MNFELTRIGTQDDFAALREAARREGHGFLDRLSARWNGVRYDDDELASVWGAIADGTVIAIGSQTFDEYDPSPLHRRIRQFYVQPDRRRMGIGRALALQLIMDAHAIAPRLHLRATRAESRAFWEAMGFSRVDRDDRTHELIRSP